MTVTTASAARSLGTPESSPSHFITSTSEVPRPIMKSQVFHPPPQPHPDALLMTERPIHFPVGSGAGAGAGAGGGGGGAGPHVAMG